MKLLLAEDDKDMARGLMVLLTRSNYMVDHVDNGLDAGADDYLAKPFDAGELLARVRALLRRRESFSPDIITYGDVSLDRKRYELSGGTGQGHIPLNNKAFQMMEMVMLSPGQILSAEQIMEHIWGWDAEAEINVVWVNISSLRKNLAKLNSKVTIRAIRGAGYTLEVTT